MDWWKGGALEIYSRCTRGRVPTRPGKTGKSRVDLEISWNFEKFNKYHGKNDMKPGKTY